MFETMTNYRTNFESKNCFGSNEPFIKILRSINLFKQKYNPIKPCSLIISLLTKPAKTERKETETEREDLYDVGIY